MNDTTMEIIDGVRGEPFTQFSLLAGAYASIRLTTEAGQPLGDVFQHGKYGGWCVDQREIGEYFIDPEHYETPAMAARAALANVLRRLT